MSDKIIDFTRSVFELFNSNPEIVEILHELGFEDITKPGMITTVGRFMTIPKGAALKKISMDHIQSVFEEKGYKVLHKGD